ncbi:hypothetical protein AAE026_08010 [Bradyrhizobium sp. DN5]|uniref:hypothetical protein n=1 Tax=Bradyrhizobium sp. DN5 TaxID=3056950 RepID=UPI0035236994
MVDTPSSLTVRFETPIEALDKRWSGLFPVEVRDIKTQVLRARGVSGNTLGIPPGTYFVTATLPDGREIASENPVSIETGMNVEVVLPSAELRFPESLRPVNTISATVKDYVRPLTEYFSAQQAAVLRGNWLTAKFGAPSAAFKREATARTSLEFNFSDLPAIFEISLERATAPNGDKVRVCDYFALPVEKSGKTTISWSIEQTSRLPMLTYDFNDGSLNSFCDFIQNGQAMEARVLSRVLLQSEQLSEESSARPLRATLGAYVMLRANEVDNLDFLTGSLVESCGAVPDVLAVRMEYLARMGKHDEAIKTLLQIPEVGAPTFRSGLGYVADRAKLYSTASLDRTGNRLPEEQLKLVKRIAYVFGELAASLDLTQSVCTFRRPTHLISPEP